MDRESYRRVFAFRVVSELMFRPGEEFIIISPTQESADALTREIARQLSACSLPAHLVRECDEKP